MAEYTQYTIWYDGLVIDDVFAFSPGEAASFYTRPVVVTPANASREQWQRAKADSITLANLEWKRGTVSAEFIPGEEALPCWSNGLTANGCGMPYFDRETVARMMALGVGPMIWDGDTVIARLGDEPEDRQIFRPKMSPDGSLMWGIGAGYWTWYPVEVPQ